MATFDLTRIPFFARLSPSEQERLGARMVRKKFKPGTAVFFQDDPSDSLYVLLTGSVKVYHTAEDGGVRVLATLQPNEIFGELAMIEGRTRSATVQTVEETETLSLSRRAFEEFSREQPAVLWKLLQALCERVRHADEERDLVFKSLPYRVLYRITRMIRMYGAEGPNGWRIRVPLSLEDLSAQVGSNPQSVSHLIEIYEDEGLLRREGENWVVPDRRALARALEYAATTS